MVTHNRETSPSFGIGGVFSCPEAYTDAMPGKKMRGIKNVRKYEALRKQGFSKASAARIANSGRKRKR